MTTLVLNRANIVDECLQSEDITRMDWPAYSPDLNPIKHVWDMLGRRIAARQPPPTCLPELQRALIDEWSNIPQDQIDNFLLSLPRHFEWLRQQTKLPHLSKNCLFGALYGLVESFIKNDEGHNVTVNGDRYRAMITNFFIPELNNHDVQELWFQQDGATCHTARATIDLLKDTFGDRLISRFGPVN
ncbi:DDE_3 domain-containing protein [Trichonephila clavipes]|uniref:DDE_3 domain-containing protein n=1 Tax=Trichonephila clavipes TaxID=2585209 RepID=A0A8X6RMJ8_TRICX|nr:DDE_3 domain-containing protein [Trichonephila clavipes]